MQTLDLSTLTTDQHRELLSLTQQLIYQALDRAELDQVWNKVDLALKQTYEDSIYVETVTTDNDEFDIEAAQEAKDDQDEFSEMFTPLAYKLHKGWTTHLKEAIIPDSGDWFGIERKYSSFFDELGINNFLPIINRCWEKNILVENERFHREDKIKRSITQFCAYGLSPGITYYDAEEDYVDVKAIPPRDFGIYPITDDWRKSNALYRYPLNYADLLGREDLDQEALKKLRPWLAFNESDSDQTVTATMRSSQYDESRTPYGTVMLHDIFMPSLYIPDYKDGNDLVKKNVFLTIAYNPLINESKPQDDLYESTMGTGVVVLKATENVGALDFSCLFATFDEVLPYQLHGKGPIIPFLVFQAFQNQLISGMSRDVARETDPAIVLTSGENDINDTPFPEFEHGSIYEGINVEPITVQGLDQRLQAYLAWEKYITEMVEEASGMSRLQIGGRPATRRTKFEVQEQLDAGGLRINDASDLFERGWQKPLMTSIISMTQHQLEMQVENTVEDIQYQRPTIDPMTAYELALENNTLFKRLLEFTALEPKYKDFYRHHESRMQTNNQYIAEFESILAQMNSIQNQLAQPFVPFQAPTNPENYDEKSIEAAKQQHYMLQQQQRDQMRAALNELQERAKQKQLMIEDLKAIPEPSLFFYYMMLIDPISESDIIVYGAKSTLNKAMRRRGILELIEILRGIPPESAVKYDIDKLISMYSAILDLSYETIKKPEEEINRALAELKQSQMMPQQ